MNERFIHFKEKTEIPRTEEANQRLRAEQRAKILDGARKVFAQTGEVAEGDPDQMMTMVLVSLDGLSRWALYKPEESKKNFPDADIILPIFKPHSDPK